MYGFTLIRRLGIVPILGSIHAWHALDGDRRVTLVLPRPDIIANHLLGDDYGSTIAELDTDLRRMAGTPPAEDELPLLEIRHVEGDIPIGLFAPFDGWMLHDIAAAAGPLDSELAAALVLAVIHAYHWEAPNALTVDGNLVRATLPGFEAVWDAEAPSFTGLEPEISTRGRLDEAHAFLARLARDIDLPDEEFLAELARVAHPDLGPALLRVL